MHEDRFKRLMSKMSDADYDEAASQAATNMTYKDNAMGHGSDAYKLPNHPTFSQDSLASNPLQYGGVWKDSTFTPSEHNLRNMPPEQLYNYFSGPAEDVRYGGAGPEGLILPNSLKVSGKPYPFGKLKSKLR